MKRLYTYSKPDAQLLAQREAEEKHSREFAEWWFDECYDDILKDWYAASERCGVPVRFSTEKYL